MEDSKNQKFRLFTIIGVVFLLLLLGYGLAIYSQKRAQDKIASFPLSVRKENVELSRLPDKFPASVPIEDDAVITQNYNAYLDNGTFQATRTFETKLSPEENLEIYTDYLTDQGWKIESNIDEADSKTVLGAKGTQKLQVSIYTNKVRGVNKVTIDYLEFNSVQVPGAPSLK